MPLGSHKLTLRNVRLVYICMSIGSHSYGAVIVKHGTLLLLLLIVNSCPLMIFNQNFMPILFLNFFSIYISFNTFFVLRWDSQTVVMTLAPFYGVLLMIYLDKINMPTLSSHTSVVILSKWELTTTTDLVCTTATTTVAKIESGIVHLQGSLNSTWVDRSILRGPSITLVVSLGRSGSLMQIAVIEDLRWLILEVLYHLRKL